MVRGIPVENRETVEQVKKKVKDIIKDGLEMPEAVDEIDKAHRVGPRDGNRQSVIVRFKSHSTRYAVFDNKKKSPRGIKLNPSLTHTRSKLLRKISDDIEECKSFNDSEPPFEFSMANKHGDILVKSQDRLLGKLFHEVTCYEDYQELKRKVHENDMGGLDRLDIIIRELNTDGDQSYREQNDD